MEEADNILLSGINRHKTLFQFPEICFGILCNICADENNRQMLFEGNLEHHISNAIVNSKPIFDIMETFNNTAKQIISFLNNSSKSPQFNQVIIQIGYIESLTSSIYRFNETASGVDMAVKALTSIYFNYIDNNDNTCEISKQETEYLLNTLEQSKQFTSDIIHLTSILKTL